MSVVAIFVVLLSLAVVFYAPVYIVIPLTPFFILFLVHLLFNCRDWAFPFYIDENGITSVGPFRKLFISWNEMKDIGVGERTAGNRRNTNQLYFSKTHVTNVSIFAIIIPVMQTKNRFYLVLREGLLNEVLKHVDRVDIKYLERFERAGSQIGGGFYNSLHSLNWDVLDNTIYIINSEGVTAKIALETAVAFRDTTISWTSMTHIGVCEFRPTLFTYQYYLYFSITPLKKTYFYEHEVGKLIPDSKQFFVPYREGLLEDVLQYVDECRIQGIEQIKNCPNPHDMQKSEKPRMFEK